MYEAPVPRSKECAPSRGVQRNSQRGDSNPQHPHYECGALPIELRWRLKPGYKT